MMKKLTKFSILFLLSSQFLVGCETLGEPANAYLANRRNPHIHSREGKSLNFPPDLRRADLSHDYDVPPTKQRERIVSLTPPGSLVERRVADTVGGKSTDQVLSKNVIRIKQTQGHLVMIVSKPAAQVWDALDNALRTKYFKIQNLDEKSYQYQVKTGDKHTLQISLKPVQKNMTQIVLTDDNGKWVENNIAEKVYGKLSAGLRGKNNDNLLVKLAGSWG